MERFELFNALPFKVGNEDPRRRDVLVFPLDDHEIAVGIERRKMSRVDRRQAIFRGFEMAPHELFVQLQKGVGPPIALARNNRI